MPRDIPLSNGKLLIAFDREYRIRDLYFPHVGKENHTTGHQCRWGVWVDGKMGWMGSDWNPRLTYAADSMVTAVTARRDDLEIGLRCEDAVDFYENVFVRHVTVENLADRPREVRVFFHQDFYILGTEVGDTAFFSPETGALLHYKDDRYFLINCATSDHVGVTNYACGQKDVAGAEGTWRDAEDGVLGGNAIAQGSVDSTLGVTLSIPAGGTGDLYYWIAAGHDFTEVSTINQVVRTKTPAELIRRTRNYWKLWVRKDRRKLGDLPPLLVDRYRQSLIIVRSQIDHAGGVLAANDTDITQMARDTYSYVWPRDGALVSVALMHAGYADAPQRFLAFCSRVVSPHGYLRHKYNPDGTLASSWHGYVQNGKPVLPIQEDETALVTWALWQYFDLYHRVEEMAPFYRHLVTRPADFMVTYVDKETGLPNPSHDLWEERWGVHAFTVAAVVAGLRGAARIAEAFGERAHAARYQGAADRMVEGFRSIMWSEHDQRFARMATRGPGGYTLDMTVDSSLFSLCEFGTLASDDPQLQSTLRQVEERLWVHTDIGGMARYQNDYYHQVEHQDLERVPGNPWFISTLWLARWRLKCAKTTEDFGRARELLDWAARHALPSGVMAEQLHPYTGEPLSVSPLTWSHAAYVHAVRDYADTVAHHNVCPGCGQPVHQDRRYDDTAVVVPGA